MDAIDRTDEQPAMPAEPQPTPRAVEPAAAAVAPGAEPQPAAEPVRAPRVDKYSLRGNMTADAEHRRKVQALELQRERILSERTSSPHRRSALATALLDIEERLAELGWTLHL